MDNLQAFKLAFLNRCAEEGLNLEQIHQRVKTALARFEKSAEGGASEWGVPKNLTAGAGLGWLAGQGDLASAGTGAAVGATGLPEAVSKLSLPAYLLGLTGLTGLGVFGGKALAESQYDPLAAEEIKAQELKNEYARLAERARRASAKRELRGNS